MRTFAADAAGQGGNARGVVKRDRGKRAGGQGGWPGSYHGGQERKLVPVADLLAALERGEAEAQTLAERAYEAIQHHAYDPYRRFCEKRAEHAALVSVLRGRIGPKPENPAWAAAANRHDRALTTLSVQACLKFSFALSATPLMPIGARETFIHELEMLRAARDQLTPAKEEDGVAALLDEIETSLMILEEIVDRAPALEAF
jgi:hypothetical protein